LKNKIRVNSYNYKYVQERWFIIFFYYQTSNLLSIPCAYFSIAKINIVLVTILKMRTTNKPLCNMCNISNVYSQEWINYYKIKFHWFFFFIKRNFIFAFVMIKGEELLYLSAIKCIVSLYSILFRFFFYLIIFFLKKIVICCT
jgi:hypothetical protein